MNFIFDFKKLFGAFFLFFVFSAALLITPFSFSIADVQYFWIRFCASIFFISWVLHFVQQKEITTSEFKVILIFFAFFIYQGIVSFIYPYIELWVWFDILVCFSVFMVAHSLFKNPDYIKKTLVVWQMTATFVCLYYFMQRLNLDIIPISNKEYNEIGSTLSNRNFMAFFIVATSPYAFYLILTQKGWLKVLGSFSLIVQIFTILICHTRAGQGILLLSIPLYFFYWLYNTDKLLHLRKFILRFLTLLYLLIALGVLILLFISTHAQLDQYTDLRWTIWTDLWPMIQNHLWFGQGVASFPKTFPSYQSPHFAELFDYNHPIHNSHQMGLEIITEGGLIGLFLFSTFLFLTLKDFRIKDLKDIRIFCSAISLLGIFTFSLIGEITHVIPITLYGWLSLAVFYTLTQKTHPFVALPQFSQSFNKNIKPYFIVALVSLILIYNYKLALKLYSNLICAQTWQKGEIDIDGWNKALAYDPKNINAKYFKALQLGQLGQFDNAILLLKNVQNQNPYFANIHLNLGAMYFFKRDYLQALPYLKESKRLYPIQKEADPLLKIILENLNFEQKQKTLP